LALAADAPPSLLWPLPFQEGCTSSFGEYRRTHFHGGTDFRTRKDIGWPLYAVADGRVVRFRREPYGYGRVLYLELKDGRTAVYGHVMRFENVRLGLEDRLLAACEKAGKSFPGDVVPDPPIPVKAGDVVAYSGDLGVGSPHLHLEIRRGDDLCDPFTEGLPLPPGLTAPKVAGLTFVPRDASGRVEGGFGPLFVPAVKGNGGLKLSKPVTVSGPFDVFLQAADHLGVLENVTGVPVILASLDGRSFFDMDLRCVSLAHYKQSQALFDPTLDRPGFTAYRLRRLPNLEVAGFAGAGPPAELAPGAHEISIAASNRGALAATLTGTVLASAPGDVPLPMLPGSGYRLESVEVLPAGVVLTCARASGEGETPLFAGREVLDGLHVRLSNGRVEVLLSREALPQQGAALALGDSVTPWIAAAGPGSITLGGVRLNLPAGASGLMKASARADALPGSAVSVRVGPYSVASKASLEFPGFPAKPGTGVFFGGVSFLDAWAGDAVPYRADGVYHLQIDRTPPSWGQPRTVRVERASVTEVRLRLTDEGAGPSAGTLRLKLDGAPAYVDWDPDQKEIRLDVTGIRPGKHTLTGTLGDYLGNSAQLPPRTFLTK
jgi:hypothetical protein